MDLFESSHCCCLLFSILQVNRKPLLPFFHFLGSEVPCLSGVTKGRRSPSTVSGHLSTQHPLAAARPHDVQVTDCPQTPAQPPASTWDNSPTLNMDLLFRSNLQRGSYQHSCMASTSEEPSQWLMPGEHGHPGHGHPSALLLALGLGLLVLLPFSHPQRHPLAQSARLPGPTRSDERIGPVVFRAREREEERQVGQYLGVLFLCS